MVCVFQHQFAHRPTSIRFFLAKLVHYWLTNMIIHIPLRWVFRQYLIEGKTCLSLSNDSSETIVEPFSGDDIYASFSTATFSFDDCGLNLKHTFISSFAAMCLWTNRCRSRGFGGESQGRGFYPIVSGCQWNYEKNNNDLHAPLLYWIWTKS